MVKTMSENRGIVFGLPAKFLKAEAVVIFAASIWLFASQGLDWWWFPVLLLVPDIFMVGYLANIKLGAISYNIGHSLIPGLALIVLGLIIGSPWTTAIGAIWVGHVGMDRAVGYGLKYHDSFKHTHLSDLK